MCSVGGMERRGVQPPLSRSVRSRISSIAAVAPQM
jgi:hypothetical protein